MLSSHLGKLEWSWEKHEPDRTKPSTTVVSLTNYTWKKHCVNYFSVGKVVRWFYKCICRGQVFYNYVWTVNIKVGICFSQLSPFTSKLPKLGRLRMILSQTGVSFLALGRLSFFILFYNKRDWNGSALAFDWGLCGSIMEEDMLSFIWLVNFFRARACQLHPSFWTLSLIKYFIRHVSNECFLHLADPFIKPIPIVPSFPFRRSIQLVQYIFMSQYLGGLER